MTLVYTYYIYSLNMKYMRRIRYSNILNDLCNAKCAKTIRYLCFISRKIPIVYLHDLVNQLYWTREMNSTFHRDICCHWNPTLLFYHMHIYIKHSKFVMCKETIMKWVWWGTYRTVSIHAFHVGTPEYIHVVYVHSTSL